MQDTEIIKLRFDASFYTHLAHEPPTLDKRVIWWNMRNVYAGLT